MMEKPTPANSEIFDIIGNIRKISRPLHDRLEGLSPLNAENPSLAGYQEFAKGLLPVFSETERHFQRFTEWSAIGISIFEKLRSEKIENDLKSLGNIDFSVNKIDPKFQINGFAEALGALYVLEGSRLGGKYLCKKFEESLGAQSLRHLTFLSSNCENERDTWRKICDTIVNYSESNPSSRNGIFLGVTKTFEAIIESFEKMQPPSQQPLLA